MTYYVSSETLNSANSATELEVIAACCGSERTLAFLWWTQIMQLLHISWNCVTHQNHMYHANQRNIYPFLHVQPCDKPINITADAHSIFRNHYHIDLVIFCTNSSQWCLLLGIFNFCSAHRQPSWRMALDDDDLAHYRLCGCAPYKFMVMITSTPETVYCAALKVDNHCYQILCGPDASSCLATWPGRTSLKIIPVLYKPAYRPHQGTGGGVQVVQDIAG